ncbi:hypothetical protein LR48_Vigan11g054600 [Vigna angularis]|uniref:Uncharacterized protein n=1 Tax=Phaseolus angularis TaxID=3914 RepID=A0A0L9VRE8_PHAAN|nr:hypothetical protein LR48_Vigan11g054600 [Vigna angularis]
MTQKSEGFLSWQSSQGKFSSKGHHDILATVIGQLKHPRQVHVARFGEITKKIRAQLYDEVTSEVT